MLERIVKELKTGKKCVLLHVNADPDALGSAIALSLSFPDIDIGAAGGLSKNGKILQKNLGVDVIEKPDLSLYDKVVIVDTPSPDRIGEYKDKLEEYLVLDHHSKTFAWETDLCHVDDKKTSCGEIVYQILKMDKRKITPKIGLALLAGIITDTGKFSYANADTLRTFGGIMEECGVGMDDVLSLFEEEHDTDYSKKISKLKGAQRLRYQSSARNIVVVSQVSTFESGVCNALLSLGADVAFVGSQRDNEFRISARTTSEMVKCGLHLGNFLADIGKELGCNGGGHDGAAGLTGEGDVEAILNICMRRVKGIF
jgi:nanoRNase/pAp phosphatase (c-di-AMP/oligoRNAs hydrolase)